MTKLTGLQRCQLRIVWLKRGKEEDFETFVQKVCEVKGIIYTAIKPLERKEYERTT